MNYTRPLVRPLRLVGPAPLGAGRHGEATSLPTFSVLLAATCAVFAEVDFACVGFLIAPGTLRGCPTPLALVAALPRLAFLAISGSGEGSVPDGLEDAG